jgi:hypothetical protein
MVRKTSRRVLFWAQSRGSIRGRRAASIAEAGLIGLRRLSVDHQSDAIELNWRMVAGICRPLSAVTTTTAPPTVLPVCPLPNTPPVSPPCSSYRTSPLEKYAHSIYSSARPSCPLIFQGESVPPSTRFLKTWRIRNCSNERWPDGCFLSHIEGTNKMDYKMEKITRPLCRRATRRFQQDISAGGRSGHSLRCQSRDDESFAQGHLPEQMAAQHSRRIAIWRLVALVVVSH